MSAMVFFRRVFVDDCLGNEKWDVDSIRRSKFITCQNIFSCDWEFMSSTLQKIFV